LFEYVLTAAAISLSGVLAPGPMTAAALAAGTRSRHAGALISLGHVVVELPLILLLAAGVGAFVKSAQVQAGIGLAGGLFLLFMGVQLLRSLRRSGEDAEPPAERHPVLTGIVLSAANPYFLAWWAMVGLALILGALEFGLFALALFAAIHWLCDLGWLELLSVAGFKGSDVFGKRAQTAVSAVCAVVLLGFGAKFLFDAGALVVFGPSPG
jgi:threonine/homoserine/homoserine lactone efflux protein